MTSAKKISWIGANGRPAVKKKERRHGRKTFLTVKTERIYRRKSKSFREASEGINRYIDFYNYARTQINTGAVPLVLTKKCAIILLLTCFVTDLLRGFCYNAHA